jgi:hypothetical protein
MAEALLFKLDSKGRGLRCDQDGLFLGNEPLLERATQNSFQPRASAQIRKILSGAYRAESDWSSRVRSVDVVAKALNNGDVARAMMAAVLMRLPEPGGGIHISDVDGVLAKAGYDPDEPRDSHGRWTTDGSDDAKLIPVQATIAEPLAGPLLDDPLLGPALRPFPGTVDAPPITVPGSTPRDMNPFPKKRRCVEEWAAAREFCKRLMSQGKFKGGRGRGGFGASYYQCLMGQVSEECGGNPTGQSA